MERAHGAVGAGIGDGVGLVGLRSAAVAAEERDAPESQDRPTTAQRGACSGTSKAAISSPPLPVPVTVRVMLTVRTRAPLVARAWNAYGPVGTAASTATVSALVALPFGGGVTVAGLYAQVIPSGSDAQSRSTADAKAFTEVTMQVAEALAPCCALRLAGLQLKLKDGIGGAVTVRLTLAVRVVAPLVPWAWSR